MVMVTVAKMVMIIRCHLPTTSMLVVRIYVVLKLVLSVLMRFIVRLVQFLDYLIQQGWPGLSRLTQVLTLI